MSTELQIQQRIATELAAEGSGGTLAWAETNPYVRRHLASHAAAGDVLAPLLGDPGFVAAAEPDELTRVVLEENLKPGQHHPMRSHLRLGPHRVGATTPARSANLALTAAAEDGSQDPYQPIIAAMPWITRFALGQRSPLQVASTAGWLAAVAYGRANDRATLLLAGASHAIDMRDGHTGILLRQFRGHHGPVLKVASGHMTADPDAIISGSADGTARIWDRRSADARHILIHPAGPVHAVAIADGLGKTVAATSGTNNVVRIWDTLTGALLQEFSGHRDTVRGLAFTQLGKRFLLASGGHDRDLRLWDVGSGETVGVYHGQTGSILDVAWITISGQPTVASASADETVWLRAPDTGEVFRKLAGPTSGVLSLACAAVGDTRTVVGGGADLEVWVWNASTGEAAHRLRGHTGAVTGVSCDVLNGDLAIASVSTDETLRVWRAASGDEIPPDPTVGRGVTPWSTSALRKDRRKELSSDTASVKSTALIEVAGRLRLIGGSHDGRVIERNAHNGRVLRTLQGSAPVLQVAAMATPDQYLVAAGTMTGLVHVWNQHDAVQTFEGHDNAVWGVAFGRVDDRSILISGSRDRTVLIRDLETGGVIRRLTNPEQRIWQVAFGETREGPMIAAASTDRRIWVWDAANGRIRHALVGHRRGVRAVRFARIGSIDVILSTGADESVWVWDAISGEALHELRGHQAGVWAVAMAEVAGRSVVVSVGEDRTVRLWDLARETTLAIPLTSPAFGVDAVGNVVAIASHRHLIAIEMRDTVLAVMNKTA